MRISILVTFNMDRTIQVHFVSSDKGSSDENETVLEKSSNNSVRRDRKGNKSNHHNRDSVADKSGSDANQTVLDKSPNISARRDREGNKSDHNRNRDSVDDKSGSDENETVLDKSSKNSARHDHEVDKSHNKGRKERDSGEGSGSPGRQHRSVEENETQTKMDMNKTALSKTPGTKRSIFDFENDEDDDVFEKRTPKNKSPADDSRQQAKKLKSRRSSRIFERKRQSDQSFNQSGMDDHEIDETDNKRSKGTEPSQRKSEKPSTSSQMSQTENPDDTQETETDEEEVALTGAQRKAQAAARSRSAHHQKILKIINQGSEAQLKTLSRIGPKTATMLYQYRKLHGKFTSIMELEDMPGWTPKVFEQFLKANNIILD